MQRPEGLGVNEQARRKWIQQFIALSSKVNLTREQFTKLNDVEVAKVFLAKMINSIDVKAFHTSNAIPCNSLTEFGELVKGPGTIVSISPDGTSNQLSVFLSTPNEAPHIDIHFIFSQNNPS